MAKRDTSYEAWLREEGITIIEGYGVEDVTELPRKPWARTGGQGAYIQLTGMEGFTGMYVGEIPAGEALNIERHLTKRSFTLFMALGRPKSGRHQRKKKMQFEWQQGACLRFPQLFASNDQWQPRAGYFLGGDKRAFDDRPAT